MAEVRKIFIYLTILAVILAAIGIMNLTENFSKTPGLVVQEQESFSQEEIAKHNSEQDCWIYSGDKVYDITLFLQIYPYDLSQECGKELKAGYFSENEMKILDEYEIGVSK